MGAATMGAAVLSRLRNPAALMLTALAGACAPSAPPSDDLVVGRPSAQQPLLEQNRWTVASVNGRETPPGEGYSMRFVSGQLSARFGCNMMGGPYRIDGTMLKVWDLSQTLMGCPEPANSFERVGAAILGEPMQIHRDPITGGPLLLNRKGRIALIPVVTGRRL